jgi:predicted DNA-binding protein (MmcQ/YjbR family)
MSETTRLTRRQALAACLKLSGAQLTNPFGDTSDVFKVSGRIFAAISQDEEGSLITLKCDPGYASSLISRHDDISPGYHMSKKHWISVRLNRSVPATLLRELITDSYDLVVAALPAPARGSLEAGQPTHPRGPR